MRRSKGDSIGKILFALTAIFLIAYAAYAAPAKPNSITFYQNASEHYANGAFSINWTANTSNGTISNYTVYAFNGSTLVINATNTSEKGYFFSAVVNNGNYTFNISAINETGESENATSTWIFVDLENSSITLNSPADSWNTTNTTVTFSFNANDNTALNCSLYVDGALKNTNSTTANNTETILNATLSEGRHLWNISCTDFATNTNTSAAYNIGIDLSAPLVTLDSPADNEWDSDGIVNFTFTATDAVTEISNCSLWTNTTGNWELNMTNDTVVNDVPFTFLFESNTLSNKTYKWNVQCYDGVSNSRFANENYTFRVGDAIDFTVIDAGLLNSSNGNNPIPGSNLTIYATIKNAGTLNATSNITVALFWENSSTPLLQNISNNTLTNGNSVNITFNVSGGNLTGYGSHNITISVNYGNSINESNKNNNNGTLILFSGLNVSANITTKTPKPGDYLIINLTALYQNGSAVTELISSNFTIYDLYTYDNGTVLTTRTLAPNNINGLQNASGRYSINVTSPAKTAANRAEYGNHTIRVKVAENKSVAYVGWDNRTTNIYTMLAPNLVISFYASSYDIDLINGVSHKEITILAKNTGTINMSDINLSIGSTGLTLLYNSTYVHGIQCNYTATLSANASSTFITIPCTIRYNSTTNGTYTLTATANGLADNAIYNATAISQTIYVFNSSNSGSTTSSSTTGAIIPTIPVKKYNYTIDIVNYTRTILIEQGNRSNITFAIKNKGNGTINNLSVKLTLPTTALWGSWYNSTKINGVYPGETVYIITNMSVPINATVATYTVTANASGGEAGSSKTVTFLIQVLPGNDTKKQITVSLTGINAQIAEINDTISKLLQNTNNVNLTLASKKLSEAIRLKIEAEQSILKGDYLTAYNNKLDIEAMLPEIRNLLVIEKQAIEKKQNTQKNIVIIIAFILAIASAFYYLWLPEEGYVPGKGYFKKNPTSYITRLKDDLYVMMHKSDRSPSNVIKEMMDKDKQNTKFFKPKEQTYNYSPKYGSSMFSLKKMSQNLRDQLKEHGKTNGKPNYNFHKKQRWSND